MTMLIEAETVADQEYVLPPQPMSFHEWLHSQDDLEMLPDTAEWDMMQHEVKGQRQG